MTLLDLQKRARNVPRFKEVYTSSGTETSVGCVSRQWCACLRSCIQWHANWGGRINLPDYITRNQSVSAFVSSKTDDEIYNDNLCVFRCITLHFVQTAKPELHIRKHQRVLENRCKLLEENCCGLSDITQITKGALYSVDNPLGITRGVAVTTSECPVVCRAGDAIRTNKRRAK